MTTKPDGTGGRAIPRRAARPAGLAAAALGAGALVAAAALLWSSEGPAIFLGQAFAALAACF